MRAAKFRETYWFKMGAASEQPAGTEEEAPADTIRPVEDRYQNPSLSLVDQAEFGLHTGATEALPKIQPVEPTQVTEQALIAELKRPRGLYLGAAFAAAGALAAALTFLT